MNYLLFVRTIIFFSYVHEMSMFLFSHSTLPLPTKKQLPPTLQH